MIHTITTLNKEGHRNFGFFYEEEDALRAVNENQGSMQECFYTHLVVESFPQGIHRLAVKESWFEWNYDTSHWDPVEKPTFLEGVISYGMG